MSEASLEERIDVPTGNVNNHDELIYNAGHRLYKKGFAKNAFHGAYLVRRYIDKSGDRSDMKRLSDYRKRYREVNKERAFLV